MLERTRKSLGSLQKGLDILCCFDFMTTSLSAQTIARRLGLPLSTTYKYLDNLQEKGFIARNPETRNYELGLTLFRLGNVVSSRMKLADFILPSMRDLLEATGETVLLTVISNMEVVCVERVEITRRMRLSLERGLSLPLHAGASSKILLAHQERSFIDAFLRSNPSLVRFTERTITDPVLLKKELRTIRRQGFAVSDQEVDVGVRAVAAAVRDHRGAVVAGLSIAAPTERINDGNLPYLIDLVRKASEKASRDMGYGFGRRVREAPPSFGPADRGAEAAGLEGSEGA